MVAITLPLLFDGPTHGSQNSWGLFTGDFFFFWIVWMLHCFQMVMMGPRAVLPCCAHDGVAEANFLSPLVQS